MPKVEVAIGALAGGAVGGAAAYMLFRDNLVKIISDYNFGKADLDKTVDRLYGLTLGRAPDPAGRAAFIDTLIAKQDIYETVKDFLIIVATSDEFKSKTNV